MSCRKQVPGDLFPQPHTQTDRPRQQELGTRQNNRIAPFFPTPNQMPRWQTFRTAINTSFLAIPRIVFTGQARVLRTHEFLHPPLISALRFVAVVSSCWSVGRCAEWLYNIVLFTPRNPRHPSYRTLPTLEPAGCVARCNCPAGTNSCKHANSCTSAPARESSGAASVELHSRR
jgi:hypothetical protein